jgi:hypothetical protein
MTATVTTGYEWVPQSDLNVDQGVYYRFVALFPAGTTQDQAYAALCGSSDPAACTKWDITSIGAPPADVMAALQSVLTVFPAASPPVAFYVIATWLPASQALSQPDGGMYYEQLAYYATSEGAPVPAPTYTEPAAPPALTPAPSAPPWAVFLVGGVVVLGSWLLLHETGKEPIPYARPTHARANPVGVLQTITANVNGRPVKFDIATDGPTWTATAEIKAPRKKRIVGSGSSKAEALQQAIGLASQAFAQADVGC